MRLLPRRRPRLPDDVVTALQVGDEQVLACSPLAVAGFVAVTPAGLRVLSPVAGVLRRPWVDVDHLAWDAGSRTLAVFWVGSRQALGLELPEDSFVPEAAHDRWRSSVLTSTEVPLPDGRRAFVALRRAVDGQVSEQVKLPKGASRTDPDLVAAVDVALAQLREDAGRDGVPADRLEW